ncbi:flippase-like domain-containing protein [Rhodopseudomonas sp. P2A-2r]|uniref:lysylphosphatidylglycerol synthase transmembrane domain-containing protein n=1 Tax=Rhodopseudomonas sp. P2A-2r TaxID=2991972 RepID=UPI002234ACA9|nr:lysylphosphatidylglycerol synthase transmembrane domain-containing protein [Rhodopseudomonas sp. P2A-2r]UZE48104.1 flippase-like domain-containing protein [Rhodopseudomonas sp. P2A-2r]
MRFIRSPIVKVFTTIGLLALIALKVDFVDAFGRLIALPPLSAIAVTVISFLVLLIQAYKTKILLPEKSAWPILRIGIISQIYSVLFFGQVGGDIARAGYLAPGSGGVHRVVAAVLFDRITGLVALLALGLLGLAMNAEHFDPVLAPTLAFLMLFLLATILLGVVIRGSYAARLSAWVPTRLGSHLDNTLRAIRVFSSSPRTLLASIAMGILFQGIMIVNCAWLGSCLGIDLPLAAWAVVICAVSLVLLLPISIGGIGLRDVTLVGLLSSSGVATERALALSFAMLGIQLVMAAVGGTLLLLSQPERFADQ